MKSYRVTIQQDENGEAFIEIPDEILASFDLKDGDPVALALQDNAIFMTFPKDEQP